jgi:lysophospholipase
MAFLFLFYRQLPHTFISVLWSPEVNQSMKNTYLLSEEASLSSSYPNKIQPFWQQVVQGQFAGVADVSIAYAYVLHPQAIGTIVISSGRIESLLKYKEVVFDLYQNGYSVFIHDHRGQGLSGRMLDNSHVGYVDDFADYVADFKKLVDEVVLPNTQTKPNLLCHSMGGAIGAKLILAYPQLFEKVAFSAPMFGIRPPLPNWFANLLLNIHFALNKQAAYFFGQQNYQTQPFDGNELMQSEIRYQIFRQEYQDNPQVQLGGVSGHWLKAAAQAMDEIEDQATDFPIPALVLQAGADEVVDNKRQTRVSNKMANTEVKVIDGSKHELLEEQDQYRVECLTSVLDFFAS